MTNSQVVQCVLSSAHTKKKPQSFYGHMPSRQNAPHFRRVAKRCSHLCRRVGVPEGSAAKMLARRALCRCSPLYLSPLRQFSPLPIFISRSFATQNKREPQENRKIANAILQALALEKKQQGSSPASSTESQPNDNVQDPAKKVKSMNLSPDMLARLLYIMSAQWSTRYLYVLDEGTVGM